MATTQRTTGASLQARAGEATAFDVDLHGCLGQGQGNGCTGAWWGNADNVSNRLEWLREAHKVENSGRGKFDCFEGLYRFLLFGVTGVCDHRAKCGCGRPRIGDNSQKDVAWLYAGDAPLAARPADGAAAASTADDDAFDLPRLVEDAVGVDNLPPGWAGPEGDKVSKRATIVGAALTYLRPFWAL
jgi:hypothetical protein